MATTDSRRASGLVLLIATLLAGGCAARGHLAAARQAESRADFDRAVVEYTNALRANPDNSDARQALERVRMRAALEHFQRGRRLAAAERYEEASLELQLATELNPTDTAAEAALRDVRQRLRTRIAVSREGKTELQALVERARTGAPTALELPADAVLPDSMTFSNASSRVVFMALAKWAGLNVLFDPAFRDERITVDLRSTSVADALSSVTATTRTFYRVTAPRTVTIVPDTAAKRREYEEHEVQTFFLSNADLKEVIDLLRVVVDVRQVSAITGVNAISVKDTPERIAAAARLITAIDKARPEVVINVELLEVDRTRLREYGLQIASPGLAGIGGSLDVNREDLTLRSLRTLTQSDVFVAGVPGLYYRLLKNDVGTRTLASPQLRTSEGVPAQARFGEKVPIIQTTFAPFAQGGINQQPITSYSYENIGVNIDITPRTHHNDEVSLALKVTLSDVSGALNGIPTFGNREISTTIRLKDGETNMLAGLIRDEERTRLSGVPGLSDLPLLGRLFATNRRETRESDIVLTLTPHIVRVLDLTEADLQPFRLGRDAASAPSAVELPRLIPPRQDDDAPPAALPDEERDRPQFPQPLQPPLPRPSPKPDTP